MSKTLVKFTKANMPYREGDVAGFTEAAAQSFINAKVAEKYEAPAAPKAGRAAKD